MDASMSDQVLSSPMRLPRPAEGRPSAIRIWFQAIRFFSFTASVIPILVGSAFALIDRQLSVQLLLLMIGASIACHAGANLANDYFDHVKGVDTTESLGPSKVIQQGLLTPAQVKRGMNVSFGIATILGLIIVAESSWIVLLLALLSLGAAFFYTGGPKPLGYIALGEVTVFIFMGPVMIGGAYFVHTGEITWEVLVTSIAVASLVADILHANNIRDIDLDRQAGKVTLATLLGRRGSNAEYLVLAAIAFITIAVLVAAEPSLWPALIVVASLPLAITLVRLAYSATDVKVLNNLLRRTAGLHLRFGSLLILGLVVRAILDRI
jgi:1,4-dihydroxy-2-naphthoate octaprenyltransferase